MTALHTQLTQVLAHLRANRWTEAHNLVQTDNSPLSNWLHGIVHIQEGDLEDAEYWYDQAGRNFRSRGSLAEEMERFEAELLSNKE
ncbi:hypothetical protein [Rhodoferax sp. WC2427]|uniref:hypothetical protein n=1 Tax=Rhodoferax sp. WC2427 TaxID=3234144 RepID=UPI0034671EC7